MSEYRVIEGDCREVLADLEPGSVQTCVTSPPYYGLRDYGHDGQIGLEPTPQEYVANLVAVFREVRRVLRDDGTLWLNLGDSYGTGAGRNDTDDVNLARRAATFGTGAGAGTGPRGFTPMRNPYKPKDLLGIPWMVAFALRADGWYLRSDIIWAKPNPMPESVTDRPTKAHEYLFLLAKSQRYYYDADAIREADNPDGRAVTTHRQGENGHENYASLTGRERWTGSRNRRSVLDRRHPALPRRTLRHLPAEADRALHPGRLAARRHRARPLQRCWHDRHGRPAPRPRLHRRRTERRLRADGPRSDLRRRATAERGERSMKSTRTLEERVAQALEHTQMLQRGRGGEATKPSHLTPVKSEQEQIRELEAALDRHKADMREQADAVLAALGLDDLDAAVERGRNALPRPDPERPVYMGQAEAERIIVRRVLEAALTCADLAREPGWVQFGAIKGEPAPDTPIIFGQPYVVRPSDDDEKP